MQEVPITQHVVAVIRDELKTRGWAQVDLVRSAGFKHESALSKRLSGEVPFSLADLERIAAALDTTVAALCTYPSAKTCEPVA